MPKNEQELKSLLEDDKTPESSSDPKYKNQIARDKLAKLIREANELSKNPETADETLDKLLSDDRFLNDINMSLEDIIDSIDADPSFISQWAKSFGEMPTVQKLSPLVVLAPLAVISIIAGTALAAMYTATSLLLEEHYRKTSHNKDNLKEGVLGLANVLGKVITSLNQIRKDLRAEVTKFKEENQKLQGNVEKLSEQLIGLDKQLRSFEITSSFLEQNRISLEKNIEALKKSGEKNEELLKTYTDELNHFKVDYEKNQKDLSATALELEKVKESMQAELAKADRISQGLKGTVIFLTQQLSEDEKNKEKFLKELNDQIDQSKYNFDDFNAKIIKTKEDFDKAQEELNKTKEELNQVKEDMRQQNLKYDQLLQVHQRQLNENQIQLNDLKEVTNTQKTLSDQIFSFFPRNPASIPPGGGASNVFNRP